MKFGEQTDLITETRGIAKQDAAYTANLIASELTNLPSDDPSFGSKIGALVERAQELQSALYELWRSTRGS